MNGEMAGKVAIVSGAAQGIGEATARRMAALGARVVLGDVSVDKVRAVAADIGDAAIAAKLDVTRESDWIEALRSAASAFGPVDVLVNNAGVMETAPLLDTADAQFQRMIDVNLRGTFLGIRTVGRAMSLLGRGAVVNVGSVVATTPTETLGVYAATKGAIASLTKVAAMELGPKGIRVCIIRPGSIATPMSGPEVQEGRFQRVLALGRIGQAAEIADAICFAASERASYMTGTEIVVDGGWSAGRYGVEVVAAAEFLSSGPNADA